MDPRYLGLALVVLGDIIFQNHLGKFSVREGGIVEVAVAGCLLDRLEEMCCCQLLVGNVEDSLVQPAEHLADSKVVL